MHINLPTFDIKVSIYKYACKLITHISFSRYVVVEGNIEKCLEKYYYCMHVLYM